MPEGNPDDPTIKKDRVLVDDPDAPGLWPRYCELEDNRPFFCNRDGIKVYSLEGGMARAPHGVRLVRRMGRTHSETLPRWLKRIEEER